MEQIMMHTIGKIHSPYKNTGAIPIQGRFSNKMQGYVQLKQKYAPGLEGLEGFSHAIILYYFHRSPREDIKSLSE
jgi:tRNA (Thr-GGU) A37 N-methylase